MATITSSPAGLSNALQDLLTSNADIVPGAAPSYQMCKTIYAYHPLGKKMADTPIQMAQSKPRTITVPNGPEQALVEAFQKEWDAMGASAAIFNAARLSRVYGVSSLAIMTDEDDVTQPLDYAALADKSVAINVYDPLNTSGSLVLSQIPNAVDFQKVKNITVRGDRFHRSRTVVIMNEAPLYLEWTSSAFGYVGRSVYQRALYPLKSFIQTMITDDMVTLKAGVLIAILKGVGSIINNVMRAIAGQKRAVVQEAQTGNVISVTAPEEDIKSLDMSNVDKAMITARKNVLDNIATAADMPAIILNQDTFAEGFGEGTEDMNRVVGFVNLIREWLQPLYDFFDRIVMHRAWSPAFYKTIQARFPESYGGVSYEIAFTDWSNSFHTAWPAYREEPESEKIKVADVQLKAIIAMLEVLLPSGFGAAAKAKTIIWAQDNFNELKDLFTSKLDLDMDDLESDFEEAAEDARNMAEQTGAAGGLQEPKPAPPFSARDSAPPLPFGRRAAVKRALDALDAATARLDKEAA